MFKKLGLLAVSTGIILSLVACGGGSSVSGDLSSDELQKLVLTGLEKWQEADSSGFEVVLDGEVKTPASEVAEAKDVVFDVTLDGQQEIIDKEEDKTDFTFDMSGNAKFNESAVGFAMNLIGIDEMLYVKIDKLDGLDSIKEAESFAPMVEEYIGDWWSYALPSSTFSDLNPSVPSDSEDEELTPEEQAQKDLYENTKFFSEIKVAGSDKIAGVKSDKIELTLDKAAMLDYQVKSAELDGFPMTEEEVTQAKKDMDNVEIDLTVWIAQKAGYLTKVAGNAKGLVGDEGEEIDLDVNFEVVLKDFNKKMKFKAPKDAKEFDPMTLLGGGAVAPTGDMGSFDMSELEGMEDIDMSQFDDMDY